MLMSPWREADLIAFCRLGELSPEEKGLLEALYDAAVGYMTQAGVRDPNYGEYGLRCERAPRKALYDLYDLCVNYLVMDSWDRRDASFVGAASSENPAFRRLLNQLKLTEPEGPPPQTSEAFAVGKAGGNEAVGGTGKAGPNRSGVFDGEDTSGPGEGKPS